MEVYKKMTNEWDDERRMWQVMKFMGTPSAECIRQLCAHWKGKEDDVLYAWWLNENEVEGMYGIGSLVAFLGNYEMTWGGLDMLVKHGFVINNRRRMNRCLQELEHIYPSLFD